MLDLMRRKKRLKLVLWVVIIGLALGMLLFFVPAARMGDTELVSSAATVDGDPISMKEFWQTYRRVIDNYSAQGRNRLDPETIRALGLGRQALDSIISIRVMNQTAKRMGLSIAPEELRQAVETYPAFQDKGSFIGVDRYKQLLTANNLTVAEFEENLNNALLSRKLQRLVSDSMNVSEQEIRDEFVRTNQEAQVQFAVLKKDDFRKQVRPSEADLQAYFEKNKSKYVVKELRRSQYILIMVSAVASTITVSEQEVRDAWAKEARQETVDASHILFEVKDPAKDAEVRAKAEAVLKQVQSGGDFAELARKHSEDTASAQQGGNLGPFPRGRMVREFEDVAFSLKPGETSGLVKTPFGYHIIKVLRHDVPSFEESRKSLERSVQLDRASDLVRRKAEEAAKLAETNKDLNAVAKALGVPAEVRETDFLARNADPISSGLSPQLLDEIFKLKEVNAVGKAVEHPLGQAIPKLMEIRLPKPPEFAESRAAVEKDFVDARTAELMEAEAKKLADEAAKVASLEVAARKQSLAVQTSKSFKKSSASDPEISGSQQALAASFDLPVGGISTPISIENGGRMLVLQVKSRTPFDEEAYKRQRSDLRDQLLGSWRDAYFQDYIRRVTEDMEKSGRIRVNSRAIDQVTGVTG